MSIKITVKNFLGDEEIQFTTDKFDVKDLFDYGDILDYTDCDKLKCIIGNYTSAKIMEELKQSSVVCLDYCDITNIVVEYN